jgi:catechol 2,3-dioxygenase-like lactoylglutathione lyase family enzyme
MMKWPVRLDQVTVGSTDLDRAEAFYRGLGLELIVKNDDYLRFECPVGGSTFSVVVVEAVQEWEQVTLYFESDDVDGTYRRLRSQGVEFEHPPTDMEWLWRESRLRDPDGHRLCLFHAGENRRNPPWRLSPPDSPSFPK